MKCITIAAAGTIAALLASAPADAQTLDDAIAAALDTSPVLSAADARVDGADARLTQARSARFPQITARGQYAEAETDFGGGRHDINPRSGIVAAEQLLFAGGRVWAAERQARAGREASEAERDSVRAALIADVADAYLGLAVSRRALTLRTSNLAALTTLAEHAQSRFDAGDIARSDLAQAQARRAGAQAALAQARADEAGAVARFRRVIGIEPSALVAADTPPTTPATREEALAAAQHANAQLIALRQAETAAAAGIWRAASQHAPTVSLSVEASSVRDEFLPGYRADGTALVARASVPLFTGGRVSGEVREARAALVEARATRLAAERGVIEDVTRGFEYHQAAREAEAAARLQVDASRTALQSIRDEASVGQRPTIDVLDAERDLLQAELDLDRAHAMSIVSAYRLNALIGREPHA
ncbi:MAG: TolC family outer membrane protein [Caulobacterales bacterium]|nr:TolC family outer membrane protein [Caulobacterales bacterium]